jgi:hypothetical protein
MIDVNGDGIIAAVDTVLVDNHLNVRSAGAPPLPEG